MHSVFSEHVSAFFINIFRFVRAILKISPLRDILQCFLPVNFFKYLFHAKIICYNTFDAAEYILMHT